MNLDLVKKELRAKGITYKCDEPMRNHTSFKIGGNADIFIIPENTEQLKAALCILKQNEIPVFILGKGSNLLVSDSGIKGAVISLTSLNSISVNGDMLTCGAGAALASVCRKARDKGLSGLEFAYGIPGSIGGAVYMNAGAYGGEISDVIESARFLTLDGQEGEIKAFDMRLGYRTSVFKNSDMIIVEANFKLKKAEFDDINSNMEDYMNRRISKQPLEYPSAGSTFKRPEGYFAGALIEGCGLKGKSVGGAEVSEKHAGFIINKGNATANDVKQLISLVQQSVLKENGVSLETEVIFVGE